MIACYSLISWITPFPALDTTLASSSAPPEKHTNMSLWRVLQVFWRGLLMTGGEFGLSWTHANERRPSRYRTERDCPVPNRFCQ